MSVLAEEGQRGEGSFLQSTDNHGRPPRLV